MNASADASTLPGLLGSRAWAELTPMMDLREFPVGEPLVRQGDLLPDFHVIEQGIAAVIAATSSGERRELGRLRPGDCAGEMSLLTGEPASADVVPVTPLVAYTASQRQIASMGEKRVHLLGALSTILAARLQTANERLLSRRATNAVVLCGAPADLRELSRLAAAIERVTGSAVTVVAASEVFREAAQAISSGQSQYVLAGDERLLAVLDRIAKERREAVVLCDEATTNVEELEDDVTHVVRAGRTGAPHATGGRCLVIAPDRWSVSGARRFSDDLGRPVCALVASGSTDMDRVARVLARRRVGVAFGAGAAKGLAHLGVLRAFAEIGLPIDVVSGASIGAAVAAGVAAGTGIDELEALVNRVAAKVVRPTVPMHSLLSNSGVRDEIRQAAGETRIEDLDIPLAIVAVDIFRRSEVTFTTGLVWPRIVASTAIPGVYPAVSAMGSYLVDGGILTPVPARQCRDLGADIVVGVRLTATRTSPRERLDRTPGRPLAVEAMIRAFEIMQNRLSEVSHEPSDVTIEIQVEGTGGLRDFKRGAEIAHAGYVSAMAAREALSEAMPYVKGASS